MAKDELKKRVDDARANKERLEGELVKVQGKFRADPLNSDLRSYLNEAKQGIAVAAEEYAELARAYSLVQGGTNHKPPPTV